MSTLTGNKISLTYKSLIKTSDNDVLTGALKELSDGLGNNSGVFLNTGGDLKSTGTLEFSNFKATAYAVTINKLVNEADGISNNDNDTSLPTSAAVKDYVDTHVTSQDLDFSDGTNSGAVDLDSQVFAIVGTSNEIETAASGQQLQIGLPNDVTISGTYTGTTFSGDLNGTINTATTAVTQTAGDNSTKVATTAYVDTLDAASDLDFSDGSVSSAVNLNTQVFSIQGTSNEITTTASGQSLTIALDSAGVNLPDDSTAITQTAGDNSTKVATTAYVDVLDAASDLDIAGDTGTGDVNLNTQTLTLQGTTNQVITAVSGQTTTFSLPSTVHRDLQGNVTGDLTGNADTATAWQTARDLSLSGEATGTLSSVDGTSNISGAVTLTNSAVTGKVLTGLPTPAAATVQPSDSILEGIGKLQSQINGIANGLQFQGTWDAATNTPTLNSGGGEVDSGTTTGQTADKLIDSSQNFLTTVSVGDKVINQVDGQSALVTNVDSNTSLTLDADIMLSGEAYTIDASPFLVQGHYYVVSVGGTTSLNGNANWAIGDWVIAGADNIWSKLDHTQIDGQGTPGNLPVWNTATTLTDSIVSESGTALTVTGSLSTTLGASVTGDFAVNTNKFTVAAASGNTAFTGDLAINTDKFTVNATSGNISVGGSGTFAGDINVGANTNATRKISLSGGRAVYEYDTTKGTSGAIVIQGSANKEIHFETTADNADLIINSSGQVGIGGTPTHKLYVRNDVAASTDLDPTTIKLYNNNDGGSGIEFSNAVSANSKISFGVESTGAGTDDTFLAFSTSANTTLAERMRITSAGNVGIGTDSPDNILHIRNGDTTYASQVGADTMLFLETTNVSNALQFTSANTGQQYIMFGDDDPNAGWISYSHSDNNLNFRVNGSEKMRITSGGNVGINETDPSSISSGATTLHIKGTVTSKAGGIRLRSSDNSVDAYIYPDSTNGMTNGTLSNHPYRIVTNGSERMRIDSSGNSNFYGNININSTIPRINLTDLQQDDWAIINDNGIFTLQCTTGSGLALTLDTSNNATFAGSVTAPSGTITGTLTTNGLLVNTSASGNAKIVGVDQAYARLAIDNVNGQEWNLIAGAAGASNSGFGIYNADSGQTALQIDSSGNSTFAGNVTIPDYIYHAGDGDTYIGFPAANEFKLVAGANNIIAGDVNAAYLYYQGGVKLQTTSSGVSVTGNIGTSGSVLFDDNQGINFGNSNAKINGSSSDGIKFFGTGSEKMRLTQAGNLGIGVTDGDIFGRFYGRSVGIGGTGIAKIQINGTSYSGIDLGQNGTRYGELNASATIVQLQTLADIPLTFGTGTSATERMRITSGGLINMGDQAGSGAGRLNISANPSNNYQIEFFTSAGTSVGTITTSGGTTTNYNTTSDYRLKEDLKDFAGLDMVSKIPVYDFKWKTDESRSYGVMAHELQEVLPQAVSGEKDAEEMQSVDYSKIVPLLVKSIQELKAEVDKLKQECKCK